MSFEKKIKVLNLYAGIGGNRKQWPNDQIDVTAVELDPKIAEIYQKNFPRDKVVVADAHQFLLEHFAEFDFIWASPPCPTHSRIRKCFVGRSKEPLAPVYPDMKLYEELLFLQGYFKGKWCIENVKSWYDPLIKPQELGRHYFWANFQLPKFKTKAGVHFGSIEQLAKRKGFDLSNEVGIDKTKTLRNCVEPELGGAIFQVAFKIKQKTLEV